MSENKFNLEVTFRCKDRHPTTDEPSPLEATALHEAGHAVANTLKGWQVEKVFIVEEPLLGSSGGHCLAHPRPGQEHTCQKRIIGYFAGPISEALYNHVIWTTGAQDDEKFAFSDAVGILKESGRWKDPPMRKREMTMFENWAIEDEYRDRMASKIHDELTPLWDETLEFVAQNELVIRAVAKHLLLDENHSLTGQRVEEIMIENGVRAETFR
ncbi:hypothetical protein EON83_10825 [bacterium]|nr:MAG: hypothetical protein EON83_10825 [bacterium]